MSNSVAGIDLKVDPSIEKLCLGYNISSGSTRSVLYVIMIVCLLAIVAVINTHKENWTQNRISSLEKQKNEIVQRIILSKKNNDVYSDEYRSQQDSLDDFNCTIKDIKKNKIENYTTVKIPILGNAFDVNNLSLIIGLSLFCLLMILRFTLTREKNNLRLALHSITERYIDDKLNEEGFQTILNNETNKSKFIRELNLVRRRYHYNSLSINEVFNLPSLEISDNSLLQSGTGRIVRKYLFYFPFFIYSIIVINDLFTVVEGCHSSLIHTLVSISFSYIFWVIVAILCTYCTNQKIIITHIFDHFKDNDYKFHRMDKPHLELSKRKKILLPLYLLFNVFKMVLKINEILQDFQGSKVEVNEDDRILFGYKKSYSKNKIT